MNLQETRGSTTSSTSSSSPFLLFNASSSSSHGGWPDSAVQEGQPACDWSRLEGCSTSVFICEFGAEIMVLDCVRFGSQTSGEDSEGAPRELTSNWHGVHALKCSWRLMLACDSWAAAECKPLGSFPRSTSSVTRPG